MLPRILDIASLEAGYRAGAFTPLEVVETVIARIEAGADRAAWISRVDPAALRECARELGTTPDHRPLWGIPFALKDNIDCRELPTTAACPAFAYLPATDAAVVARLRAAGAILIGKTNLDQFATGLNGTRSPYGAPRCVFNADYIAGGSSSGSAVVVAAGQVSFALGTDTAGSGRVPAAFNNIVGLKPTRGLLSLSGVVPACRSLDCVSVFAATVGDAQRVTRLMAGYDESDPYSRAAATRALPTSAFRFGVPDVAEREFHGDEAYASLYANAIERLAALGGTPVVIDYVPFREAAESLYGGARAAERIAAIRPFYEAHREAIDPSVLAILDGARRYSAADAYHAAEQLERLRRQVEEQWRRMDLLLLPTTPTTYSVEAMRSAPIALNTRLGRYTNFVNLLDCCAVAVPAGFTSKGLPFGVTLVAPAFADDALAVVADRLHRAAGIGAGIELEAPLPAAEVRAPAEDRCTIAVVGAHLSGMALNHELTSCGGRLVRVARTKPDYRLFVLPNTQPAKPGLVCEPGFSGPGIQLEVWSLPAADFGRFVARIPAPLGIGKIALEDGGPVSGFLCESRGVAGAQEITALGGWRAYVASLRPS